MLIEDMHVSRFMVANPPFEHISTATNPSHKMSILRARDFFFEIDDFLELGQEPAVDFAEVENFVDAEAGAQGVANEEDAFGVGDAEFAGDEVPRKDVAIAVKFGPDAPRFAVAAKSAAADFE